MWVKVSVDGIGELRYPQLGQFDAGIVVVCVIVAVLLKKNWGLRRKYKSSQRLTLRRAMAFEIR